MSTTHVGDILIEETLNDVKKYIKALKYGNTTNTLGVILSNLGLKLVDSKSGVPLGAVDEKGNLYINYENWKSLKNSDKMFLLLHEAVHIATADTERYKRHFIRLKRNLPDVASKMMIFYNIITDAINNEMLRKEFNINTSLPVLYMDHLVEIINRLEALVGVPPSQPDDIKSKRKEELFIYVESLVRRIKAQHGGRGGGGGKSRDEQTEQESGEGDVDSELEKVFRDAEEKLGRSRDLIDKDDVGDKNVAYSEEPKATPEEMRNLAKQLDSVQKMAGKSKGELSKLIEASEKEIYLDWRELLKYYIMSFTSSKRAYTWMKESRRLPTQRPGYRSFKPPNVYVMIDISGSMEDIVPDALSIIRDITETGSNVYVIGWDTEIRWVKELQKGEDIKIEYTGGGTVLSTPLMQLEEKVEGIGKNDVLVIITDGILADSKKELKEAMYYVDGLFKQKILLTVNDVKTPDGWVKIFISFD